MWNHLLSISKLQQIKDLPVFLIVAQDKKHFDKHFQEKKVFRFCIVVFTENTSNCQSHLNKTRNHQLSQFRRSQMSHSEKLGKTNLHIFDRNGR